MLHTALFNFLQIVIYIKNNINIKAIKLSTWIRIDLTTLSVLNTIPIPVH